MEAPYINGDKVVEFDYKNWKGEVSRRKVVPIQMFYGKTPHHSEPEWLVRSWDLDKNEYRTFAFSGMLTPPTKSVL